MKKHKILKLTKGNESIADYFKKDSVKFGISLSEINKIYKKKGLGFHVTKSGLFKKYRKNDDEVTKEKTKEKTKEVTKEETKEDTICNFIIIPTYDIKLEKANKVERYLILRAYILSNEIFVDFGIRMDELDKPDWISKKISTENAKLKGDYEDLKNAIQALVRSSLCEKRRVIDIVGWHLNHDDLKWEYLYNRRCFDCIMKLEEGYSAFFKDLLDTLSIDDEGCSIKIFTYGLLAIKYELLRRAGIEPNFILNIVGGRDANVMQIVEFFISSMNTEKGFIMNCDQERNAQLCSLYNDNCIIDFYDKDKVADEKLIECKDRLVLVDCIMDKGVRELLYKIKTNYFKRRFDNNVQNARYNALPIVMTMREVNQYFSYIINFSSQIDIKKYAAIRDKGNVLNSIIVDYTFWLEDRLNTGDNSFIHELVGNYKDFYRKTFYDNVNYSERDASITAWFLVALNSYLEFGLDQGYIEKNDLRKLFGKAYGIFTGVVNNSGEAFANRMIDRNDESQEKQNRMFLNCLKTIKHIYEEKRDELCKERKSKQESEIGWLVPADSEDKEPLLCIDKNEIQNILNLYYKKLGLLVDKGDKISFNQIENKLYKEECTLYNNGKSMDKGNKVIIRKDYKIGFKDKKNASGSDEASKNEKKHVICVAFRINKVMSLLSETEH